MKAGMFGRIDMIHPTGDNCDRSAFQRALMGSAINAAGKAGHDGKALSAKASAKIAGEPQTDRGGVARADDGAGGTV